MFIDFIHGTSIIGHIKIVWWKIKKKWRWSRRRWWLWWWLSGGAGDEK